MEALLLDGMAFRRNCDWPNIHIYLMYGGLRQVPKWTVC